MKKLLQITFGVAILMGLLIIGCAASTLDHPGSIPISDAQILMTGIIGVVLSGIGAAGWQSLEHR